MFLRSLPLLLALASAASHAMTTDGVSESKLKAYGATLAEHAGSTQWQQLWKNTRDSGQFMTTGEQARFTVPMKLIPELVRSALADADGVTAQKRTQALYRRDFAPRVVGTQGDQALTAICLNVDWRSLPSQAKPADAEGMGQVSLLKTWPCE